MSLSSSSLQAAVEALETAAAKLQELSAVQRQPNTADRDSDSGEQRPPSRTVRAPTRAQKQLFRQAASIGAESCRRLSLHPRSMPKPDVSALSTTSLFLRIRDIIDGRKELEDAQEINELQKRLEDLELRKEKLEREHANYAVDERLREAAVEQKTHDFERSISELIQQLESDVTAKKQQLAQARTKISLLSSSSESVKLFQADVEQTSANEEELSEITREQKELETEIQSLQEQLRNNIEVELDELKSGHGRSRLAQAELRQLDDEIVKLEIDGTANAAVQNSDTKIRALDDDLEEEEEVNVQVEPERPSSAQFSHVLRNMIATLIDSKAHTQQPFAIALSLLKEQGGQLEFDQFKQRLGEKVGAVKIVQIVYAMAAQKLIEIDRSVTPNLVKTSAIF